MAVAKMDYYYTSVRSIWLAQNHIENNTWMLGNVKFSLSVDQDISQLVLIKSECMSEISCSTRLLVHDYGIYYSGRNTNKTLHFI